MDSYADYFDLEGPEVAERLREIKHKIEPYLDDILQHFYSTISRDKSLADILGKSSVDHLKKTQKNHWLAAMEHGLTRDYENRVVRIGTAHERIGLNLAYYVGAYNIIFRELLALKKGRGGRLFGFVAERAVLTRSDLDLLLRLLTYDMALSIMVYQEKSNRIAEVLDSSSGFLNQLNGELQQAATSVTELSSSVKEISDRAHQAQENAGNVARNMARVSSLMSELNSASAKIGKILEIIQDISNRTNLLSLNALIEAARAGEHGRGFGVVADEVKKLANQTNISADEIGAEILSIQQSIKDISGEVATVAGSVAEIEQINTGISVAVHQQSSVTDQIEEFVQNVLSRATSTQTDLQRQAQRLSRH